jgi:heme exporter protein C
MSVADNPVGQVPERTGEKTASASRDFMLRGLTVLALAGFFLGLYLALAYAGTDVTQGEVQRVFYIHVSAFSGASIGFGAAVFGGIMYLRTKNPKWDTLAVAGVEVGLVLALINLVLGMIWARPIWNTWWTWDPRLTSAAVMILTYAAYLLLRNGIDNVDRRRVFAAVYGILAISTVIFTFVIIRIRPDTIHPTVIGPSVNNPTAEGGFAMASAMKATLGMNSAIWCILIAPALMWWRIRLQNKFDLVQKMRSIYLDN